MTPHLGGGSRHNYSTQTRLMGCANEQSFYSLMSMEKNLNYWICSDKQKASKSLVQAISAKKNIFSNRITMRLRLYAMNDRKCKYLFRFWLNCHGLFSVDTFQGFNVKTKHSSFLNRTNWGIQGQCYKTFHCCNLQIFVIGKGVCPRQAFFSLF